MIAGHFGLAAGVKAGETAAPLWALMLATVWLDIVFVPLVLLGVESIENAPGTSGGYGNVVIHADYTHSLVGALLLAGVFAAVAAVWWRTRVALVLGAVVFSHWLLDLVVHRADMPVLPGNAGDLPLLGLGLWRVPAASVAVELLLVLTGSWLYWRAARRAEAAGPPPRPRANRLGALALGAGVLTLVVDAFIG
ncbi:permease [Georgenia sp. SYP-B2076]|uniref:permease n=1 Tax=Georgenia sp. SYP-B2076 TaxID=2495881 RepID=UPI000F8E045D|nr:permease [Georgenia sp. SYP-B2076]